MALRRGPDVRLRRCSCPGQQASPHVPSASEHVCVQALLHTSTRAEEVSRYDARHTTAARKLPVRQEKQQD